MPDQTGLELLAQKVGDTVPGAVLGTLHFRGQATILAGAAAMAWTQSFVPMALAGSAALMLTLPLVKAIAAGQRSRR